MKGARRCQARVKCESGGGRAEFERLHVLPIDAFIATTVLFASLKCFIFGKALGRFFTSPFSLSMLLLY
jgi:hypothetical protein